MTIAMERDYRLLWMYFDRYGRMQPAAMLEIFQDLEHRRRLDRKSTRLNSSH